MNDSHPQHHILVVDDEPAVSGLLRKILEGQGYSVRVAPDGPSALQAIAEHQPDVVLLDVNIPHINGFEVCRRLKREPATRLLPVVLVTGLLEQGHRIEGLEAGADDFLTKPVDTHELLARVRSLAKVKGYTDDLDSANSIIATLAVMIEARDGYREGHCHRMANYAMALGRKIGLGGEGLHALQSGGFLHDIGMLAIPDAVLRTPGPLTPEEYELVKSHPVVGDSICQNLRSLQSVRPIVRHHHERRDGSGYPDGLRGDDIPLLAQVMAVADVYDAVTSQRPYHGAKPSEEAIEILRRHVETGWQRHDLVEEFVALIQSGSFETFVPVT